MLDWRLKAFRLWLTMDAARLGQAQRPADRLSGRLLLRRAQGEAEARQSLDEVDPEILRVYEKLGIPIEEQKVLAGVEGARKVAVDAVFDSVSVATTFREELEARGRHLPLDQRGDPRISRAGAEVARQGRAACATITSPRSTARSSPTAPSSTSPRACAARWSCQHLFPHQRREYRPVRTHADRRRQGQLRLLSRRLHRADARREPAPRRGGRAGRAGRCRDQIFDRAELVSRRRRRQGRHLQFRHQARAVPGREQQGQLDPGRDRQRDHLEISDAACSTARTASANSTRSRSPTTASRPTPAPR